MKQRLVLFFLCFAALASAQQKPSQQWLDQKFSMFIHFGLYSVYGGVYDGKPVERGYSEQIQSFAGIFSDWYANTANQFNPTQWNADEIVQLAKDAGMRSIVFTSKHHDGFCMYHSQYTDFNIVDATPYGRDLMKELADACARGGIEFSVYYSLIDWNFPQAYPISSHNADPITPEHYAFNLKQVEEIMTNYGEISEIWFDMGSLTPEQSKGLYDLVTRLQPQCMISGRLGNDYVDFAVMADNEYPDYKLDIPWQTAASMFDETWGYRSWQKRGEVQPKVEEKIASLIQVISRGGNYLLNIGPRGDGSVVEFERDVLLGIGEWVKANAEAIYGTRANPLNHPFHGFDATAKGDAIYFFAPRGEENRLQKILTSQPFKTEVSSLGNTNNAPFTVFIATGFEVKPENVLARNTVLTPQNATPVFGHSSLNYYAGYKSLTGYDWAFRSGKRQISPQIMFSDNEKGREIQIDIDGNEQTVTLNSSAQKTVRLPKNAVKWGDLYRKRSSMVFGNLADLEGFPSINTDENWQKVTDFKYGAAITEKISPKSGVAFLQKIESAKEQPIAVEIKSGNAVYILLNGEYITAHFSPNRVTSDEETVFLPLKKGENQLVIVFYNGFDTAFSYRINPLEQWTVYTQNLSPVKLDTEKEFHSISVRDPRPISSVAPLRMNNIQIRF
ncbi:MAG: alpha-L-fucosidase [Bacteroidia bacterium]|nr:alpha-L-fucosidase [Bacteroidia bacterium]